MSEHKVLLGLENCYFNNANGCVICGMSYESGGIETGFSRMKGRNGEGPAGKVEDHVCPWCMAQGPVKWKEILLKKASLAREYAEVARPQALDEAEYYESLAADTFILPTPEEEAEICRLAKEWGPTDAEWELPYRTKSIVEHVKEHGSPGEKNLGSLAACFFDVCSVKSVDEAEY